MPPLSAWGLLGDTLTGGANAYLKARNELPLLQDQYDEVAFRKQIRPIELEQARQQLEVQRAKIVHDLAALKRPSPKVQMLGQNNYFIDPGDGNWRIESLGEKTPNQTYAAYVWDKYFKGEATPADEQFLKMEVAKTYRTPAESGRVSSGLDYATLPPIPGQSAIPPVTSPPTEDLQPGAPTAAPVTIKPLQPSTRKAPSLSPVQDVQVDRQLAEHYATLFTANDEKTAQKYLDFYKQSAARNPDHLKHYVAALYAYQQAFGTMPPGVHGEPTGAEAYRPAGLGPTDKYVADTKAAERKALGEPGTSREQAAIANNLYPGRPFAMLQPDERDKVNQAIAEQKEQAAANKALKDARPALDELDALDNAKRLADMVDPLIDSSTVGVGGWAQRTLQNITQNMPYLPQNVKDQLFNPNIPKLDVLSSVIAYLHAAAMKKQGGSGTRGVTVQDIKQAEQLFNTHALLTNPAELKARLQGLQEFLQADRPKVEKNIRSFGIDPATRQPIKGHHFATGDTVNPAAPEAPEIEQEEDEALQRELEQ